MAYTFLFWMETERTAHHRNSEETKYSINAHEMEEIMQLCFTFTRIRSNR